MSDLAAILTLLAGASAGFGLGFVAGAAFGGRSWARRMARAAAAAERSRQAWVDAGRRRHERECERDD